MIACIVFVFAALMEYTGILLQVNFGGQDGDVLGGYGDVSGSNGFGDCQQLSLNIRNPGEPDLVTSNMTVLWRMSCTDRSLRMFGRCELANSVLLLQGGAPFFNRPAPNENFGISDSKPASPESKPA